MSSTAEDTLPEEAWKDSFDKLLDQRTNLREMHILKKDVRSSFNMDSSYENSWCNDVNIGLDKNKSNTNIPATRITKQNNKSYQKRESISTPSRRPKVSIPFKCALSPVEKWEFALFDKKRRAEFNKCLNNNEVISTPKNQMRLDDKLGESTLSPQQEQTRIHPNEHSPILKKGTSQNILKHICFETNIISADSAKKVTGALSLQTGKWRKSLKLWRQTTSIASDATTKNDDTKNNGHETNKKISINVAGQRKSTLVCKRSSSLKRNQNNFKRILLRRCTPNHILPFEDAYNVRYFENCCKIGEGAFGEVFLYTGHNDNGHNKTVLKVIPIEGKELINGEVQKSFEQILQEVIICLELCALNDENRKSSYTSGFVNIERVRCVKGEYPVLLQKLWEEYNLKKDSENDHPNCFTSSQQYIVLEMSYSGNDMEKFVFRNAEQSFFALHQIIYSLAVAEVVYQFEHRDLHWGNILVLETKSKEIVYKLKNKIFTLPTKGLQITIIDYTLSRITYNNYCYYNDLSSDAELFTATGDYQFEIYRMMRNILNDKWDNFEPKTNIFWISYIISKMLDGVIYKDSRSKRHSKFMQKLRDIQSSILTYASCMDYIETLSVKDL